MSSAFAWINGLIQSLGRLVPRMFLVRPTFTAVVFGPAGRVRVCHPGLNWLWPICHEVRLLPITTRVSTVQGVVVDHEAAKWDVPIAVSTGCVVTWRLDDVLKAIEAYSLPRIIEAIIRGTLVEAYDGQLGDDYAGRVEKEIRFRLWEYGISLEYCKLTDTYRQVVIGGDLLSHFDQDHVGGETDAGGNYIN